MTQYNEEFKSQAVELALKNGGINENTNEIQLGQALEKV